LSCKCSIKGMLFWRFFEIIKLICELMDLLVFVKFAGGGSICMYVFTCNVFQTTVHSMLPISPKVGDGCNIYVCMWKIKRTRYVFFLLPPHFPFSSDLMWMFREWLGSWCFLSWKFLVPCLDESK
jgi:hypothetical protein